MQPSGFNLLANPKPTPADFRLPSSSRYHFGLLLAIFALALLPLMYLALVAAPVWLTHLLAPHVHRYPGHSGIRMGFGHNRWLLRAMYLQLLVYLFLLFYELALLVAVLKPLFAGRRALAGAVATNPSLQPAFYSFVAEICQRLDVASPKRIELDCGLNASVHFSRGTWSFLKNDLTLRIGLPLVAALNARELAGVIAHEIGHFRQGLGLRSSFLIRGINRWLTRAVRERDSFDFWLERESHYAMGRRSALLVDMATLAIARSRGMLKLLMFPTQIASSFLLRQMEHDADRYEIKLAGSMAFETTTRRLAVLAEAAARATIEARAMWSIGRHLPDDFPEFVLQQEAKLPIALRDIIEARLNRSKTRLFDSHPADGERLRRARAANQPGIVRADLPASDLFTDFHLLCRQATFPHYTQNFGLNVESANLRSVAAR